MCNFDITKQCEIYSFSESITMIEELLISIWDGDQCHCQKVGWGKLAKSGVANQQFAKSVNACLMGIAGFKSQNNMGTGQGEYCVSIFVQFKKMQHETFLNWYIELFYRLLTVL